MLVAAIVLLPEGMTAIRAALNNQLQTSINLTLGSAVAGIGLTVPAVSLVACWTDHPLAFGVDPASSFLYHGNHHLRDGPRNLAFGRCSPNPDGNMGLSDPCTLIHRVSLPLALCQWGDNG